MMRNGIRRLVTALCCLGAVGVATTGCIKDDLSDCSREFKLTVKAEDNNGANCDPQVQDVMLYLFDGQYKFIKQLPATVGVPVGIEPLVTGEMHIVAWGNIATGGHALPAMAPGDPATAGHISLAPDTRAASPFLSPGDLFRGAITLTPDDQTGERVIPMRRKTGSMNITVKKLKEFSGFADNNFSIRVGETHSQLDLAGTLCGPMALYRPDGTFANSIYNVPSFNMLCGTGLSIEIYHGTTKIFTVDSHNGGQPIAVEEGLTTSVVIDFTGEISVSVSILPWGKNSTDKEF